MKLDHEWFEWTQTHSKTKVALILCVFSSSDVGSKWQLLYSLPNPTTKHFNRLIGDISSSLHRRTALSSLRGRGYGKMDLSINSRGRGLYRTTSFWQESQRTAWFEKRDFKIGIKKKHWVDFYHYRMDVYTHFQHTIMFK